MIDWQRTAAMYLQASNMTQKTDMYAVLAPKFNHLENLFGKFPAWKKMWFLPWPTVSVKKKSLDAQFIIVQILKWNISRQRSTWCRTLWRVSSEYKYMCADAAPLSHITLVAFENKFWKFSSARIWNVCNALIEAENVSGVKKFLIHFIVWLPLAFVYTSFAKFCINASRAQFHNAITSTLASM